MRIGKLWQRYFLFETWKVFTVFVGCLYVLYVLIDYAVHTKVFNTAHIPLPLLGKYYVCQFSKRAEILLPFALMVAGIKVLTSLNTRNELVALLAAGIPIRRLLMPFILTGLAVSALLLANYQVVFPRAVRHIDRFEMTHFHEAVRDSHLGVVRLQDGSRLVYQLYDPTSHVFRDVFWVRQPGDLYRMQRLDSKVSPPLGLEVDHLIRTVQGEFVLAEHFSQCALTQMKLDREELRATLTPPESLALTELWQRRPRNMRSASDHQAQIATQFFAKLGLPLLPMVALLFPIPFCLKFGRHLPIFFIFCLSILAFLSLLATFNAIVILGEGRACSPIWVLAIPLIGILTASSWIAIKVR